MDYMTLKEASKIWGVTPRWINYYCSAGRIPGAEKMGTVWLIPKNAKILRFMIRQFPFVGEIAKPAEPVNGQDERAVPAVDSPARLC